MKDEESQIVKDFKELLDSYDYDMEDLDRIWAILMDKVTYNNDKLSDFYEDERRDVVNDDRAHIPEDSYLRNDIMTFTDHYRERINKEEPL